MNLDTEGGHVLLLELSGQMTLDEGGLVVVSSSQSGLRIFSLCGLSRGRQDPAIVNVMVFWDVVREEGAKCRTNLSGTAIADKDQLEGWDGRRFSHDV